jgi:hypothetical protein
MSDTSSDSWPGIIKAVEVARLHAHHGKVGRVPSQLGHETVARSPGNRIAQVGYFTR